MKQKSIKKNMIMNIILTVSNFLFPLITYGYASRILTPVSIGKVSFVSSVIQYFSYIAILGIPAYGLREASKVRDDKDKLSKLVQELFIINVASTIISLLLLSISVLIIPKFNEYRLLFLVMSLSILLNTIGVEWLYKAMEEYSYITVRSLIFKIIYIPLVFLLIKDQSNYVLYGFLTIFVTSANYICNFFNIRKIISFKRYEHYNFKKHLKPILILFSASMIISIYANFDIIMIGLIRDEYSVGLYNTALKIKSMVLSLSTAVTTVLIPRIANYISKKDYDSVKRIVVTSFKTSMLLALPMTIYILIYAKQVILVISGIDYVGATSTLQVLMGCVLFLIMTNLFGNQLLIPLGLEKRFTKSVFIGLFINLGLNIALIPKYGSFGAALGTLVTEFWNLLYMGFGVEEYAKTVIHNTGFMRYIVSIILSVIVCVICNNFIFNSSNIIQIIVSLFAFGFTYYLSLFILGDEYVKRVVSKLVKVKKYGK